MSQTQAPRIPAGFDAAVRGSAGSLASPRALRRVLRVYARRRGVADVERALRPSLGYT